MRLDPRTKVLTEDEETVEVVEVIEDYEDYNDLNNDDDIVVLDDYLF